MDSISIFQGSKNVYRSRNIVSIAKFATHCNTTIIKMKIPKKKYTKLLSKIVFLQVICFSFSNAYLATIVVQYLTDIFLIFFFPSQNFTAVILQKSMDEVCKNTVPDSNMIGLSYLRGFILFLLKSYQFFAGPDAEFIFPGKESDIFVLRFCVRMDF